MVNLVTANADMLPGVYNFNIVATPTGSYSGVTPGTFTQACSVTVGTISTVPVTPPTAIAASGYTQVFFDDFTTTTTVTGAVSNSLINGVNWYALQVAQPSPTNYTVLTTTTAAALANGNSGGGANASTAGGLWKILGISSITDNGNFQSVPNNGTGINEWKHAYFECYMQFNAAQSSPTGWTAFWSWSDTTGTPVEIDFMEAGTTNIAPNTGISAWTIHDPGGEQGAADVASGAMQSPAADSNWHTYGCLWKSVGANIGTLDFYLDNTHIGGPVTTGTGRTVPDLESITGQYLTFGCGVGIPIYVDWVRVWQP